MYSQVESVNQKKYEKLEISGFDDFREYVRISFCELTVITKTSKHIPRMRDGFAPDFSCGKRGRIDEI